MHFIIQKFLIYLFIIFDYSKQSSSSRIIKQSLLNSSNNLANITDLLDKNNFNQRFIISTRSKKSHSNSYSNNATYYTPIRYFNDFQSTDHHALLNRTGHHNSDNKRHKDQRFNDHQFNNHEHFDSKPNDYAQYLSKNLKFEEVDPSNETSKILEKLLLNYDKNDRPNIGGQTTVTTNIHIRSMGPMSEQLMEYSLDCYFRQKWHDPRLKYEGPFQSLTLNIHMLDLIWKPDSYFLNSAAGSYVHEITRPNKFLRINQDGGVYYSMRLTVKARCFMELKNFPMDKQSCPLMFGSYGYKEDELKIVWDHNEPVSLAKDLVMSQFDLISYPIRNGTRLFRKGTYSLVQVNFNFIRHTGYFVIQIYLPCGLIVVLSWVSFWISRENTADRVGLGITSVLTLSTFGLEVSQSGPKVSYPTALNWFMIICFLFTNATLIQFSFVHYFTKIGSGELPFYYQQLKTKERNKEKSKREKINKLKEKIKYIDEQTKYLKETNLTRNQVKDYSNSIKNYLMNSNEFSLLSEDLTGSYDDSNDNLILNTSFEDEEEIDNQFYERDRDLQLQMLDIKKILNIIEINKNKNRMVVESTNHFNDLQAYDKPKLKRRSHSNFTADRLKTINPYNLPDDFGHYLGDNLENDKPTYKHKTDQIYCPKHNRWFSSSISASFDDQLDRTNFTDEMTLHGHFNLEDNENLQFNNLNARNIDKKWAVDVNRTSNDHQYNKHKYRKKSKIYCDYNSLEQKLPFVQWKKVCNQNLKPLSAFNLNPLGTAYPQNNLAALKRNQFKKKNSRHSRESNDNSSDKEVNASKINPQQLKSEKSKDIKLDEHSELDALFDKSRSNDKIYWFEKIKLPKLILQFITCIVASEDYRERILRDVDEEEHVNSVSRVDTLSKFLFPFSFLMVNIIYWFYYNAERNVEFPGWSEFEVFEIV